MKRRRYIYIALSLVTVVGVLGTVALGLMAGSAKGEEDDLRAQIAAKQAELQKIKSGDVEAEKERLAELEAELEELESAFPVNLDSTDVMEMVLQYAEETNIKVLPIKMSPATTESVMGQKYYLVTFDATVEGTFPDILAFIDKLENGPVETVSISEANLTSSPSGLWTAELSVSVFSQIAPEEEEGGSQ